MQLYRNFLVIVRKVTKACEQSEKPETLSITMSRPCYFAYQKELKKPGIKVIHLLSKFIFVLFYLANF